MMIQALCLVILFSATITAFYTPAKYAALTRSGSAPLVTAGTRGVGVSPGFDTFLIPRLEPGMRPSFKNPTEQLEIQRFQLDWLRNANVPEVNHNYNSVSVIDVGYHFKTVLAGAFRRAQNFFNMSKALALRFLVRTVVRPNEVMPSSTELSAFRSMFSRASPSEIKMIKALYGKQSS